MYDTDTEAKRTRLEVELAHVLQHAPFPTSIAIAARGARITDLQARLRELPPREPPLTGMNAGGSTTVHDRRLGTDYIRPEPTASDESRHAHNDDPMIREFGDSIT